MIRIFRALLAVSLLLYVGWIASFYWAFALFSEDVARAIAHNGAEAWVQMPAGIFWLFPVLWVIATIGMWHFSQGFRGLFGVLVVGSIVFSMVSGMSIQSGPQAALGEVVSLMDGAILAIAFFASVDSEFRKIRGVPRES